MLLATTTKGLLGRSVRMSYPSQTVLFPDTVAARLGQSTGSGTCTRSSGSSRLPSGCCSQTPRRSASSSGKVERRVNPPKQPHTFCRFHFVGSTSLVEHLSNFRRRNVCFHHEEWTSVSAGRCSQTPRGVRSTRSSHTHQATHDIARIAHVEQFAHVSPRNAQGIRPIRLRHTLQSACTNRLLRHYETFTTTISTNPLPLRNEGVETSHMRNRFLKVAMPLDVVGLASHQHSILRVL